MQEFALSRDIDIRVEDRSRKARVKVNKRDVMRGVQNLLHNAIKYSWSKGVGRPWITIRSLIEGSTVVLEIENYGVPIPRYEIEQELIFGLGYRGSMSGDRSRLGTGIGLYDARRVAREHGGDVLVNSRPASHTADIDDLTKPYITIARMELPTSVKGI
jgi:signal transduction histidine kinase